jgi:acyl-CoA thioester hydrolase
MPRDEDACGGWDHPDPFVIEVVARAEDIDSYRHVNNAVYLTWLERCAWAHSAAVGLPESTCLKLERGMAVHRMRLDYLKPARAGDAVRVGNWIAVCDGRVRATRRFQIRRADDGSTLLRGEIDYVCLNLATGRPARMPDEFRNRYRVTWPEGA